MRLFLPHGYDAAVAPDVRALGALVVVDPEFVPQEPKDESADHDRQKNAEDAHRQASFKLSMRSPRLSYIKT